MEQRRLRLGDILDDYCPRERRVTNHAIVAMIEEEIRQTRCTTCDAEHAYKGAKLPRRRKKETPAALYKEVLAGMPEGEGAPVLAVPASAIPVDIDVAEDVVPEEVAGDVVPEEDEAHESLTEPLQGRAAEPEVPSDEEPGEQMPPLDEGPVHRPLIRATLPRPEGQKDTRPLPEFTVRQAGRPGSGQFRGARPMRGHAGPGNGNGNRSVGPRFPGARAANQGRGASGGGRGAQQGRGQGGGFRGRKRSR